MFYLKLYFVDPNYKKFNKYKQISVIIHYFLKNAMLESMAKLVLRIVEPASILLSVIT